MELTSLRQERDRGFNREQVPRFTGHERDYLELRGDDGHRVYLDYMHARVYNPNWGRFLSVDPGKDWDMSRPQSWNMYAYVRNNPVNRVDRDGRRSDSPRNHCRGVTEGPCATAMKNWQSPKHGELDRIFWRAMGKLGLVVVSTAVVPMRVLAGAAGMGAAANATKESKNANATPQTIAGGAIDGAANGAIARGGKGLADLAARKESQDKATRDDAISGFASVVLGNDLAIILGLAPLPSPGQQQQPSGNDVQPKKPDEEEKRKL